MLQRCLCLAIFVTCGGSVVKCGGSPALSLTVFLYRGEYDKRKMLSCLLVAFSPHPQILANVCSRAWCWQCRARSLLAKNHRLPLNPRAASPNVLGKGWKEQADQEMGGGSCCHRRLYSPRQDPFGLSLVSGGWSGFGGPEGGSCKGKQPACLVGILMPLYLIRQFLQPLLLSLLMYSYLFDLLQTSPL